MSDVYVIVDDYDRPADEHLLARLELELGGSWSIIRCDEHPEGWGVIFEARFDRTGPKRRGHWRYRVCHFHVDWGSQIATGWSCVAAQWPSQDAPRSMQAAGRGRSPQEALDRAERAVYAKRAANALATKNREKIEQSWREVERAAERRAEFEAKQAGLAGQAGAAARYRPVRAVQLALLGEEVEL